MYFLDYSIVNETSNSLFSVLAPIIYVRKLIVNHFLDIRFPIFVLLK